MSIKEKIAVAASINELCSIVENAGLGITPYQFNGEERSTNFTKENVALANEVVKGLVKNGYQSSKADNTTFLTKDNKTISIGQFSSLSLSHTEKTVGSFKVSITDNEISRLPYTGFDAKPQGEPKAQATEIIKRVQSLLNQPLRQVKYSGLGLHQKVDVQGQEYVIGGALFNDESASLYTQRDFDSFEKDLDSVKSHNYVNGKFEYLGQDKPLTMSFKELEETTGRPWGNKKYKRKSAALSKLDTLTNALVLRSGSAYHVVPPAKIASMNLQDTNVTLIGLGANVSLNDVEDKFDHIELDENYDGQTERDGSPTPSKGRTSYVVTAKGDEVETSFKLVEASELVPSNTQDGRINPDFPQELQPRDRTRVSSKLQISKMASDLRPQQLTDSGLSSHGAPIVGGDNVVESGNGRTMAVVSAYQQGKADHYRQYLIDNAERFDLDASDVKRMKEPVLVRERITELDRAKFARDSNISDLQQMSAAETAWVDAERINDQMIALFNPSETGNLLAQTNQGFINSFLTEIGDNSTAGLLTEDGRPTKQLIERMQNAVFAKAYKNEKLVKLVSEEPDPEIRNILNALNGAASAFVEMQYLNGQAHKQTTSNLASAIDTLEQATPVFTVPPEELERARTELEATRDNASSGRLREADRKYALKIVRNAVDSDRGNHPYSNVRGLADVAVYRNKQYPDLPIVVSTKVMKDLAAHAISPEKIVALSRLNEVLPTMRFTGKRYETDHNEQKHSSVKYWEDATANFKVGDKTFEIGVKTRCIENGVQGEDSLSPYSLWDKDIMVENLASARGGISQGEPESRISQQGRQPSSSNIQPEHELIKYLEVSDITITEIESEPTLAENALESLVSATELVRQAKGSGQNIDELLAQSGLFGDNDPEAEALARFIANNNRSAKRMATAFKAMAEAINQELLHQGQAMVDMFGGGQATLIDILGRVNQELESDGQQAGFMFESVDDLANEAATSPNNDLPEPTAAQKEAGNYRKGRLTFSGFAIAIENPKGSLRTGTDDNGQQWSIELKNHYGDISGTMGADGDPIDVFLGHNQQCKEVFIVNQVNDNGDFDEHKVMLGFDSAGEAKEAYLSNYSEGWDGIGSLVAMSVFDFAWWLRTGDMNVPATGR